jgi:tetratricopeptide (TPR) repeat protein
MRRRVCIVVALGGLILCSGVSRGQAMAGENTADPVAAAVALGDQLREKEDWDGAIAAYTKAIGLNPKCAKALCGRGRAFGNKGNLDALLADLNEAIRLDPKYVRAYFIRGSLYARQKQWQKAQKDLSEAIRLSPNSPFCYERRAMAWIDSGDYDRGIADLQAVFRLNPKDPAAAFESWPKTTLSSDAMQHGRRQVEQMLKDRPAMAQYGDKSLPLQQWAARKFAGEDLGQTIQWDGAEPVREWEAECNARSTALSPWSSSDQSPVTRCIRVRRTRICGSEKGKGKSFEELWSQAVFELYNTANCNDFNRVAAEAAAGKLSRHEFARKTLEVEGIAAEKTRSFYVHVFLPWAKQQHLPTNPVLWCVAWRSDPKQNLFLLVIGKDDPHWRYYEQDHDEIVMYTLVENGQDQKADALAAEMEKRAATNEEKAAVFVSRGRMYAKAGNFQRAIADCSRAIQLTPKCAAAFRWRGMSYGEQGNLDKAISDLSEAIRLDPKNLDVRAYRGRAFAEQGHHDKAIAECNEVLRLDPKSSIAYWARGGAFENRGDLAKALADYSEAIRLDGKYCMAYFARGNLHAQRENFDGAITDYTEAIRLAPAFADAYYNLAATHQRMGQLNTALADCDEGIRRCPKNALLHVARGTVFAEKGDLDKAMAEVKAALALDPKDEDARGLRQEIGRIAAEAVGDGKLAPPARQAAPAPSYGLDEAIKGTPKQGEGAADGKTKKR